MSPVVVKGDALEARQDSEQSNYSALEYQEKFELANAKVQRPGIVPKLNFAMLGGSLPPILQGKGMSGANPLVDRMPPIAKFKPSLMAGSHTDLLAKSASIYARNTQQFTKASMAPDDGIAPRPSTTQSISCNKVVVIVGLLFAMTVLDILAWNSSFGALTSMLDHWVEQLLSMGTAGYCICSAFSILFLDLTCLPGRIAFRVILSSRDAIGYRSFLIIILTDLLVKNLIFWICIEMSTNKKNTTTKTAEREFFDMATCKIEANRIATAAFHFATRYHAGMLALIGMRCSKRLFFAFCMTASLLEQSAEYLFLAAQNSENIAALFGRQRFSDMSASLAIFRVAYGLRWLTAVCLAVWIFICHNRSSTSVSTTPTSAKITKLSS